MRIVLLILLNIELINGISLTAQTEAMDSLNRALNMTLDMNKRVVIINRIAYELRKTDPLKSKALSDEALALARKSESKEEIAFALNTKGSIFNDSDDFLQALNCYLEVINIYSELNKDKNRDLNIAYLNYQTGSLYKTLGDYPKAIESCLNGLEIYEKAGDNNGISLIYRVMGSIYKYKEDYKKSLFYYFNGLEINEKLGNQSGIANSFNNIGVVYLLLNDMGQALHYYKKSLLINLSQNIESEAAINYGNLGVVYLRMNMLDSALYFFNKKYNASKLLNDKKGIALSLESFGDFYLKKKEYIKAIEFYNNALSLSRNLGILETSKNILKSISELYQENSDFNRGLTYYKSYIDLRDSLLNRETVQRIEEMDMEYSFEKEKNNLAFTKQKTKLYIILGFASLLLSILLLFLIYLHQNLKLKRKNLLQKKLEIDKQQLQNEVYFRDKELVSKAINLAEKNELLIDITHKLERIIVDRKVGGNEVREIIKDLRLHSNTHLWDEFEYTFLQVHPDYYNSLGKHFPELTPNERRLSAFLRLNLTTKEISNITHQSIHSLTVARTRLRKKLGISNSGENLASFLSKI